VKRFRLILILIIIVIVLLVILSSTIFYFNYYIYKLDYLDIAEEYATFYDVDIELVMAIIMVESSFQSKTLSAVGAVGLMQIMPSTASYIMEEDVMQEQLYEPRYNILVGVKYLAYLYDRFEDTEWVIVAYNAGETITAKWIDEKISASNIPYNETKNYLPKVLKAMSRYEKIYDL